MRNIDVANIAEFCEVALDEQGRDVWGNMYVAGKRLFEYRIEWYEFCSVDLWQVLKSAPDNILAQNENEAKATLEETYPRARWNR